MRRIRMSESSHTHRVEQGPLRIAAAQQGFHGCLRVVSGWAARHPRGTFHFTPTSASWLNAVEGFFAILTKRRLKRGVFRSVADLQTAINRFLSDHNAQSKPFQWVADPDKIIRKARASSVRIHPLGPQLNAHPPFGLNRQLAPCAFIQSINGGERNKLFQSVSMGNEASVAYSPIEPSCLSLRRRRRC